MTSFTYQPVLRPALPCVYGPLEYREYRFMFERIDRILSISGLEQEFINLALSEHQIDTDSSSASYLENFARRSVLVFRSNIAKNLTGLSYRDFCSRLADSQLLQWFLNVGEIDGTQVFSKSSCERYNKWVSAEGLRAIHDKFTQILQLTEPVSNQVQTPAEIFGLPEPLKFDDIYFDSTCLKANIHFPVDWVLLRDAARSLMKATLRIREHGLKHRMPQEPLEFLSEMNTLCMKMTAKGRMLDGKKQKKKVLREMKSLEKRIANHAKAHLTALKTRRSETDLSEAQAQNIIDRIQNILDQLPAAVKQAHERLIGGRQVATADKILSLYDDSIHVIKRGKAGAAVEFGNKLWMAENNDGIIADYKLYQDNPADSALLKPAIERLVDELKLDVKSAWSDRGITSKINSTMLDRRKIKDGCCPRDVQVLSNRLTSDSSFRKGLKRRAGTEARIGIFQNVFLGSPLLAKGFKHRELAVGWAALTHNLWVVARAAEAEKKRIENLKQKAQESKTQAA